MVLRSNVDGTDLGGSYIWSFGPKRKQPRRRNLVEYVRNRKENTGTSSSPGGFRLPPIVIFYILFTCTNNISTRRTSRRNSSAPTQDGFTSTVTPEDDPAAVDSRLEILHERTLYEETQSAAENPPLNCVYDGPISGDTRGPRRRLQRPQ